MSVSSTEGVGSPYFGATAAATGSTGSTTGTSSTDQMNKDMFLKLMVAQLRYQDPSKPADSSAFIAQTAQFTQVEKMDELVKQNAQMLLSQRTLSAGVLVGTHVTYMDEAGLTKSGTVDSVRLNDTEPMAMVNGDEVPLGRIQSMSQAKATAGSATT